MSLLKVLKYKNVVGKNVYLAYHPDNNKVYGYIASGSVGRGEVDYNDVNNYQWFTEGYELEQFKKDNNIKKDSDVEDFGVIKKQQGGKRSKKHRKSVRKLRRRNASRKTASRRK